MLAGDIPGKEISVFKEFVREIFTNKTEYTKHLLFFACLEKFFPKPNGSVSNQMLKLRDDLIAEITDMLGDDGVLIAPACPESAQKHGTTFFKVQNVSNFTMFNILGNPVTQCPIGLDDKTGCPLGLQIAANPFNDHLTIEVAQEVEKLFGGWVPPFKKK